MLGTVLVQTINQGTDTSLFKDITHYYHQDQYFNVKLPNHISNTLRAKSSVQDRQYMDFPRKPVSASKVFLMSSNKKLCLSKEHLSEI